MSSRPSLDDYIDVAERLQDFKDAHPDGSLQTVSWEVAEIDGKRFVVYRAAAYRAPDDPRPGHGIAWEPFPGTTPYTKNSELMNAETAAWGRAIVALGLASNRKLASRQEVRNRSAEQEDEAGSKSRVQLRGKAPGRAPSVDAKPAEAAEPADDDPVSEDTLGYLRDAYKDSRATAADLKALMVEAGAEGKRSDELTERQGTWVALKLQAMAKERKANA